VVAANLLDHPAVLLLVAFVALIRWLISKAKSPPPTRQTPVIENTPPPQPITRGGDTRTEEERIRKFLEALGQPAGTPPRKVTPRPPPAPPKIFPRLPPLKTAPPPIARDRAPAVLPPPLPTEARAAAVMSARPLEADYQVSEVAPQTSSEPPPETRQRAARSLGQIKLGTPQDLRSAIVLREIFGPPRSLQPIDITSGP
jgi:hypothetical protein